MKKKKEVKFWNDSIQEIAKLRKLVVIKSVCPLCESKRWKWYSKNVKQCLICKTQYGQTVL